MGPTGHGQERQELGTAQWTATPGVTEGYPEGTLGLEGLGGQARLTLPVTCPQ